MKHIILAAATGADIPPEAARREVEHILRRQGSLVPA